MHLTTYYNNKGFTLIELVAALFVFLLVTAASLNLLMFASNQSTIQYENQEILEAGRISMDFIINQVQLANGYRLTDRETDDTTQLDLFTQLYEGDAEHQYVFVYYPEAKRLDFGGVGDSGSQGVNELASYVSDVRITVDKDLQIMYIQIEAENEFNSKVFNGQVSVKYKMQR